jgi:phosphopentomutase
MKRAIVIVLDSVGIGELPDAGKYGDIGSNTIGNIAKKINNFSLPNMQKIGLGNIDGMVGIGKLNNPQGCYGKMVEVSTGKDTTTGHWELMGIQLEKPFPVYPNGFPKEIIDKFEKAIGIKTLGNCVASGTEIIKTLGQEHVKTGLPIIYTSADSVFQIAAHEEVIPLERLYEMCKIARNILVGEHAVGRVIARPFIGKEGSFTRTPNRHDFSIEPTSVTAMDIIKDSGMRVKGVGKIQDIFGGKGLTDYVYTKNNMEGVDRTLEYLNEEFEGFIFTNLVDFDMIYGHRNDIVGYANALIEFDMRLPEIIANLKEDDILFITADHGCDPTTPSTDHSREYIPLLAFGKHIKKNVNLQIRETFSDLAATITNYLALPQTLHGTSFLNEIIDMS